MVKGGSRLMRFTVHGPTLLFDRHEITFFLPVFVITLQFKTSPEVC